MAQQSAYSTSGPYPFRQQKGAVSAKKPQPSTGVPTESRNPDSADAATVLKLEDSSTDSTAPVSGASGSVMGDKPIVSAVEAATESSTGGFETMLGSIVVEGGLVTPDEMELCNSMLRESA